jgi:hypothetical protein
MRRYFVRLTDGTVKQVENRNDAEERVNLGLATEWWKDEDDVEHASREVLDDTKED